MKFPETCESGLASIEGRLLFCVPGFAFRGATVSRLPGREGLQSGGIPPVLCYIVIVKRGQATPRHIPSSTFLIKVLTNNNSIFKINNIYFKIIQNIKTILGLHEIKPIKTKQRSVGFEFLHPYILY